MANPEYFSKKVNEHTVLPKMLTYTFKGDSVMINR